MHVSVGALIVRDGKYLMIDRVNVPRGFAGLAGHVDEGEEPLAAIMREVREESGLTPTNCQLLAEEEVRNNVCSQGVPVHYWYVYSCEIAGEPVLDPKEARSIGWYSKAQLRELPLEPVWSHWFRVLNIL